ncbi:GNAT family N-acetyltransferase [Thermodesulfobacteriota bacterium]
MIQSITDLNEFEDIREEWDALYRSSGISNLFLTHKWLCNWIRHFGGNRWAAIIERGPVKEVPTTAVVFRIHEKSISHIDTSHSYFPGILHLKDNDAPLKNILPYLKKSYKPRAVNLLQNLKDGSILRGIQSLTGTDWYVLERSSYKMRAIDIYDDFDLYLAGLNKKVRHEIKRKIRRIKKDGPLVLHRFDKPDDMEKLFKIISDVEKNSWKYRSGSAILSSESEYNYYRNIFDIYSQDSLARSYVLTINNIPVSYVLGVVCDSIYYALKTSYTESHARFSPGTVLFSRIIQELSLKEGDVSRIELLGDDARWKKEICTDSRIYCTHSLFPVGIFSFLYVSAYKYYKGRKERK